MTRYRTNHGLRLRWDDRATETGLAARPFGSATEWIPVPTFDAVDLLEYALDGRSAGQLRAFGEEELGRDPTAAEDLVGFLVDRQLVVPVGEWPDAAMDWYDEEWQVALHHHLAMRGREPAVVDRPGPRTGSPSRSVRPGQAGISLPDPEPVPARPFDGVLLARRTCRDFSGTPVDLAALSSVLHHAFRPTRAYRDDADGSGGNADGDGRASATGRRSSPAAVHDAVEAYVAGLRVDGLDTGLYRYAVADHALDPTDAALGDDPAAADDVVESLLYEQPHCRGAAAGLFLVLDFERYRARCRDSLHFRHAYVGVSALLQRLLLAAVAFDLEVFQSIAYRERAVDDLLGVDGVDRAVAYFAAVGHGDAP